MHDKEKRKGLPTTRGVWYLIAGVAIGIASAYGAFSVMSRVAPPPIPVPPLIPTPIMGVPNAMVQAVSREAPRLNTFAVNEANHQLVLSYWDGQDHLEVRPWLGTHPGLSPLIPLSTDQRQAYGELSLNGRDSKLAVTTDMGIQIFDLSTGESVGIMPHVTKASYSPDGKWMITLKDNGVIGIQESSIDAVTTNLLIEGVPYGFIFNPSSTQVAVVSKSKDEQTLYIEVFNLFDVRRDKFYSMSMNSFTNPIPRFSADGYQIAIALTNRVAVFSLYTAEERFFDVPNTVVSDVIFDPSGNWLVISSADVYSKETSGLYFYPLSESAQLPTTLPSYKFIPLAYPGHMEFVEAGLLVSSGPLGASSADDTWAITLYSRTRDTWQNGDTWGSPSMVLTGPDLE